MFKEILLIFTLLSFTVIKPAKYGNLTGVYFQELHPPLSKYFDDLGEKIKHLKSNGKFYNPLFYFKINLFTPKNHLLSLIKQITPQNKLQISTGKNIFRKGMGGNE